MLDGGGPKFSAQVGAEAGEHGAGAVLHEADGALRPRVGVRIVSASVGDDDPPRLEVGLHVLAGELRRAIGMDPVDGLALVDRVDMVHNVLNRRNRLVDVFTLQEPRKVQVSIPAADLHAAIGRLRHRTRSPPLSGRSCRGCICSRGAIRREGIRAVLRELLVLQLVLKLRVGVRLEHADHEVLRALGPQFCSI